MALRIPSPKALTKPEAYLAYKAGILSRDELKQNLYNPLNNYEGWLAKWCGLLETYPTNEDGTPQCLTDEEGLLAYLCGVTDRYPASNSRPDDARISAYIRYLVSARYTRPDHPLNREEFYLSIIKTQFIPSGDPSSDIVIDGTTKAPFLDVKMYGDSYQQTYSGKNLLKLGDGESTSVGISVPAVSDNSITIKAESGVATYNSRSYDIIGLQPGQQYTISCNISGAYSGTNGATIRIDNGHTGAASAIIGTLNSTRTTLTFTVPEGSEKLGIYFYVAYGQTPTVGSTATFSSIQLEKGSAATDYEPYVGGTPAPNPDYPQPISVVTGENVVKVVGKNLWNGADPLAVTGYDTYALAKPLPAGTYTLSVSSITTTGTGAYSLVMFLDSANQTVASNSVIYSTKQRSFTLTSEATQVRIYSQGSYQQSHGVTTTFTGIQIESGSTATSYEPYQGQDYTIDLDTIELAKIGTYQDRIYKDGEKWYVEKNVGKVVLDGSEDGWSWADTARYTIRTANIGAREAISDHFTYVNYTGHSSTASPSFDISSNLASIGFHNKDITSLNNFKTWLSTNPTTVYYALATPTITEITNQTLIDQLNALKQGGAEEGTTYIKVSATDPNLPAKLYVEAPKYD